VNHVFDPPTNYPDDHLLFQARNLLECEQSNAKLMPLATSLGPMNSNSYMDVLACAACGQNAKRYAREKKTSAGQWKSTIGTAAGELLNVAHWYYRHLFASAAPQIAVPQQKVATLNGFRQSCWLGTVRLTS
jgi:hypothetical protein